MGGQPRRWSCESECGHSEGETAAENWLAFEASRLDREGAGRGWEELPGRGSVTEGGGLSAVWWQRRTMWAGTEGGYSGGSSFGIGAISGLPEALPFSAHCPCLPLLTSSLSSLTPLTPQLSLPLSLPLSGGCLFLLPPPWAHRCQLPSPWAPPRSFSCSLPVYLPNWS